MVDLYDVDAGSVQSLTSDENCDRNSCGRLIRCGAADVVFYGWIINSCLFSGWSEVRYLLGRREIKERGMVIFESLCRELGRGSPG
jgi:hypothetical protein